MNFIWETPEEINMAIAQRLRGIRKRKNLTQQQLSEKSNVSFGSIKRFETTGQISLISLTKLAVALDCTEDLKRLFANVKYNSIEEVIREWTQSRREGIDCRREKSGHSCAALQTDRGRNPR